MNQVVNERILTMLKNAVPPLLKPLLRSLLRWAKDVIFWIRYGFAPPPIETDLCGYKALIDFIEEHKILDIEGDFVEIGVFLGGGTYTLSKYLTKKKSQKRIYAVDIFDITVDTTANTQGQVMAKMYANILRGRDQWEVFSAVTKGCHNIVVIKGDSKKISLPAQKICFAFIDGNHEPSYVVNDFYLVWPKLSPGGVVAFDDYGHDLPMVTKTVDELLVKHLSEVVKFWQRGKIIYIQKRF